MGGGGMDGGGGGGEGGGGDGEGEGGEGGGKGEGEGGGVKILAASWCTDVAFAVRLAKQRRHIFPQKMGVKATILFLQSHDKSACLFLNKRRVK